MFFYRCCAATLGNIEPRDRASTTPKDPSFHRTCLQYWAGRENETAYTAERVVYANSLINEVAKMMEINARNMVALHFRRRLHQYIRFRYAPQRELQFKYKDTKWLVDSCYRVRKVPAIDDEGRPTGQSTSVWTEWDATNDPIEKELREWLGIVPWEWQLRQNSAHFVRKLYDMLTWMEMFVEEHPSTRGARLYSFVPVATTFQAAYVKINASTMFVLFCSSSQCRQLEGVGGRVPLDCTEH